MADIPQAGGPPPGGATFSIEKIYVKDLSLENPGAPMSFRQQEAPGIEIGLRTSGDQIEPNVFESVLTVTLTAKAGERTVFLVEAAQAGIFTIKGVPPGEEALEAEKHAKTIEVWGPTIFPGLLQTPAYARAVVRATHPLSLDEEVLRAPRPPFTEETAILKVQLSEDDWNSRDPERVAVACTLDSEWRNRFEFLRGRQQIVAFLTRKWGCELEYRLRKTLWTFTDDRIAVRFAYEWHDDSGSWFRSYGNENWEFDEHGLMRLRIASINDLPIKESERKYHWPLGPRPDDHPGFSALGL
jgi:hypothetical protein